MNAIDNLVHLYRRQCDERRHYLVELERLAERLRADAQRLHEAVARSTATPVALEPGAPSVARPLYVRYRKLARSVADIDAQIAAARDALAEAERELRRHEQASLQLAASPRGYPALVGRRARTDPPPQDPRRSQARA